MCVSYNTKLLMARNLQFVLICITVVTFSLVHYTTSATTTRKATTVDEDEEDDEDEKPTIKSNVSISSSKPAIVVYKPVTILEIETEIPAWNPWLDPKPEMFEDFDTSPPVTEKKAQLIPTTIAATTTTISTTLPPVDISYDSDKFPLNRDGCMRPIERSINCTLNKSYLDKNQKVVIPKTLGNVISKCGTKLMFSTVTATWLGAHEICCSIGMQLVTIETIDKMKCFHKLNFAVVKDHSKNVVWSSASDEGCKSNFWWYSGQGSLLAPLSYGLEWKESKPAHQNSDERCLAIQFNLEFMRTMAVLLDDSCNDKLYFICQTPWVPPKSSISLQNQTLRYKCDLPKCPKPIRCKTDDSSLFPNVSVNVPASRGYVKNVCGKTYFISNSKDPVIEAERQCCRLGMRLLTLKSQEETNCLANAIIGSGDSGVFYTSATDEECTGRFAWCPETTRLSSQLRWLPGRPAHFMDAQHCVVLVVSPQGGPTGLSDVICYYKLRSICETTIDFLL